MKSWLRVKGRKLKPKTIAEDEIEDIAKDYGIQIPE